jgi:hypothetical protein
MTAWIKRSPSETDIPPAFERVFLLWPAFLAWLAASVLGIAVFSRSVGAAFAVGIGTGVMTLAPEPIQGLRGWLRTISHVLLAGGIGALLGLALSAIF